MDRLSREQWLDHGLLNLAESGFTSLKADTLAKSLGVSRGSFYWHFKDLATFQHAVIQHWQTATVAAGIKQLEVEESDPAARLAHIISIGVVGEQALERSIRAWALNNEHVKQTVDQVDHHRLRYLQNLIEEIGLEPIKAKVRARIIYCGFLGQIILGDGSLNQTESENLIEELVNLAILNQSHNEGTL